MLFWRTLETSDSDHKSDRKRFTEVIKQRKGHFLKIAWLFLRPEDMPMFMNRLLLDRCWHNISHTLFTKMRPIRIKGVRSLFSVCFERYEMLLQFPLLPITAQTKTAAQTQPQTSITSILHNKNDCLFVCCLNQWMCERLCEEVHVIACLHASICILLDVYLLCVTRRLCVYDICKSPSTDCASIFDPINTENIGALDGVPKVSAKHFENVEQQTREKAPHEFSFFLSGS